MLLLLTILEKEDVVMLYSNYNLNSVHLERRSIYLPSSVVVQSNKLLIKQCEWACRSHTYGLSSLSSMFLDGDAKKFKAFSKVHFRVCVCVPSINPLVPKTVSES